MGQIEGLSESKFAMWRGVIFMIHADNVVTPQEISFINDCLKDTELSPLQLFIIAEDLKNPKNPQEIFDQITNPEDKKNFFKLARAVSWCDGDFAKQERHIIDVLESQYFGEENLSCLEQSREGLQEVELHQAQWSFKKTNFQNFLNFFNIVTT